MYFLFFLCSKIIKIHNLIIIPLLNPKFKLGSNDKISEYINSNNPSRCDAIFDLLAKIYGDGDWIMNDLMYINIVYTYIKQSNKEVYLTVLHPSHNKGQWLIDLECDGLLIGLSNKGPKMMSRELWKQEYQTLLQNFKANDYLDNTSVNIQLLNNNIVFKKVFFN